MNEHIFDEISDPLSLRVAIGLTKISQAIRSQGWKVSTASGLTPTQIQVLSLLLSRSKEAPRLSVVAEHLGITAATASEAVTTLVRKGLVIKTKEPGDSRALALSLTEHGLEHAQEVAAWPDFLMATINELNSDDQLNFYRLITLLISRMQEKGDIPISRMCVNCQYFEPHRYRSESNPHHCHYVDAPFGDNHLRLDCNEHQAAEPAKQNANFNRFLQRA